MAALTEELKLLVVSRLASFVKPADILRELKLNYKVETTLQQLSAYDPDTLAGKRLSAELKAHYEKTRKHFLEDLSDVPLAHTAGRLRFLTEIAYEAKATKNLAKALEAAEQIAKDLGGMFVRMPANGRGGDPGEEGGETPDADAEAAERSARVDALVESARARRDGKDPS